MLKHCVFIRFKEEVNTRQRDDLYQAIHNLQNHLSGWLGFVAGANVTVEAGMDKGFNGGFIIDLADAESRDTYLADEQHKQVGKKLVAAAEGGIDGILVFDMEV